MGNITNGIVKAINGFTTPEALTTEFIKDVCLSDYTLETIRGVLINPVKSRFIPKDESRNDAESLMYISYALMHLLGFKKCCNEVFKIFEEKSINDLEKGYKEEPEDNFYTYIVYGADTANESKGYMSKVIPFEGAFLYVEYLNSRKDWNREIRVYFVGPCARSVYKKYKDIKDSVIQWIDIDSKAESTRKIMVYSMSNRGGWRMQTSTVPSTIIMDHIEGDIDEITKMINRSANIAEELGINKTVGVLLHGPHGSGKSTIARYLSLILNRALILTTSDNLSEAIEFIQGNRSGKKFIMLIEDIDFMFTDRRKQAVPKKGSNTSSDQDSTFENDNDDMNKRTSLLFQVLDGVLSNSNLIVIATTNYFDRLDPALIRDGRFDYKIELKGLDYETAVKVCEKFGVSPDDIDLKNWKLPIPPATLQTVLLKYKVTNINTYDPDKIIDSGDEN